MIYECEYCKKEFINKNDYEYHIKENETSCNSEQGYFYIVQLREFIKCKEEIYLIGVSKRLNPNDIMKDFPTFSHKYLELKIKKPKIFESIIKTFFEFKFINRKEFGNNYFEGNINHMIECIKCIYEGYSL
jgi:hypothetical protein